MDEPRRDKQIGLKLTEVEQVEIASAASFAGMETAPWCRRELLNAARGSRAVQNVEVPKADLDVFKKALETELKVQLEILNLLLQHTHFGDPSSEHEDPNARALGTKRAARKMEALMKRLNLNGGEP
jgi:hypothetical protein